MKQVLLTGQKICKCFGRAGRIGKDNTPVLQSLDIELYEGDFTVVMGASGAGKSTLLYALSGMDAIDSGSVRYKEEELTAMTEPRMAGLRAREFGFVFQQTHLVSNLTLFENVAVAGYLSKKAPPAEIDRQALALLEQMGVGSAKDRMPAGVSGGEAQRAALARAMIGRPGLLFADEPTGALNRAGGEVVLDLLTGLAAQGQSILMVTHDPRAALRGNRLLYLEDGKLIDELCLAPYDPAETKTRGEQVGAWLGALQW